MIMVTLVLTAECPVWCRDYATFMALSSSGQGEGGAAALASLQAEMGNRTWTEFCGLQ